MESLRIEKTNETPFVEFDKTKNIFRMEGRSLPENAASFYAPILTWLKLYAENPNKETVLEINFEYFNSASSKQIFNILFILKQLHEKQFYVRVCWVSQEDDELNEEEGKEFEEILNIPFEFVTL